MFAEPASPCPQMKVTASRGGDRHSGDDSLHEATSSRTSSSRDQLSDVSAPAALLSQTLLRLSGARRRPPAPADTAGPGLAPETHWGLCLCN